MNGELRWVGPDPSAILELVGTLDLRATHAGVYLADAIVDGKEEFLVEMDREYYVRTRAEARRMEELCSRFYGSGSVGRWAGYLVRDELAQQ